MPAVSSVEAAGYEEPAAHRIAHYDTTIDIPEFHCIEEHAVGLVFVDQPPGLSTVHCLQDIGRLGDSHDDGCFGVERFNIAKVSFFITGDDHPRPGLSSILGFT